MEPSKFGDSHDMAKRQIMQWLAPDEEWRAHPMWYLNRPEQPHDNAFLREYAGALNIDIVDCESRERNAFLEVATECYEHLILDPDKGLSRQDDGTSLQHVAIPEFIQIVNSPNRKGKLTLIYDGSHSYHHVLPQARTKLQDLRAADENVHAVSYIAHEPSGVAFVWASKNPDLITNATRRMQKASRFPSCRFVDDNCGRNHVCN